MNSIKEIIEWANKDLADWESDLVRRLLKNELINEDEKKQIIANVFKVFDIDENGEQKNCTSPFLENKESDIEPAVEVVNLCSVHAVENVNAIHNSSRLPFSHSGITIIYGENGSGKSGYTRILKNACFAKYVEPEILKNVYKNQNGPQSAKITFLKNGERITWDWTPGKTLTDLSFVNVFDSDSGKILLEKNNQVTYKPKGLEIFDSVSSITNEIKDAIFQKTRKTKLPDVPEIEKHHDLNVWIKSISEKTTPLSITTKFSWSAANQAELNSIQMAIQENENGTSTKKIEKISLLLEARVPKAIAKLKSCLFILNSKKADEITALEKLKAASKIAYESSLDQIKNPEPLAGVHSEAWKLLFNAAKEFSEAHAYPGEIFPNIEGECLCVLCMQPLEKNAKERLSRFESYIIDKTKRNYETVLENLRIERKAIEDIITPEQEVYEPLCNDLIEMLGSDHELESLFKKINFRKEYFTCGNDTDRLYPVGPDHLEDASKKLIEALTVKKQELLNALTPEKHAKIVLRHTELKMMSTLNKSLDLFLEYRESLAFNKNINSALNAIKSTKQKFSTKAKLIISQLVTPEFIKNFDAELKFMGVSLVVKISSVVKDSDTSHSFSIATKRPGRILSEGEQKVISLAAFLAEIKTFKNNFPIILDDPVSSLDHIFREKIAERLANEALERQVIVFTHDISLIMEIEGKCEDIALSVGKGPARSSFTIRRNGQDSGFCYDKSPWRGMSTAQRAQQLDEDIHGIKELYNSDVDSYNQRAALVYCLLREAWESLIEQDLFCQIVTRGRNSVQTLRLNQLSIEAADANIITQQMTKASNWMFGHDKSKALTEARPNPAEILEDISKLRSYSKEIISRRKITEKDYGDQLRPPLCEVG
jgi:energy-coupling factor transporter ATP-binding protein EcfA2